jgi:hypothetical protein
MRAGAEILEALDRASKGVQAAATELAELSQKFHEAHLDADDQIVNGLALQYEIAIKEQVAAIYDAAIDLEQKPPPADVRQAKAERWVRTTDPHLWAEYHAMKSRIDALKTWISNQKATISANQSIRKGEIP